MISLTRLSVLTACSRVASQVCIAMYPNLCYRVVQNESCRVHCGVGRGSCERRGSLDEVPFHVATKPSVSDAAESGGTVLDSLLSLQLSFQQLNQLSLAVDCCFGSWHGPNSLLCRAQCVAQRLRLLDDLQMQFGSPTWLR